MKCTKIFVVFQRFASGTLAKYLDKPKLIAFPDVICSQAYPPIRMDREC